jgi:hypothetical protein
MSTRSLPGRENGSTLLVALFVAALVGVICAGLLVATQDNLRYARRFFYNQTASNLAESGIELGLRALNASRSGSTTAWDGWSTNSGNRTLTLNATDLGPGITGQTFIAVLSPSSGQPQIAARSIVTLPEGAIVEEWAQVDTSGRSLFGLGLLTRTAINASGTSFVDSWNSDPDSNPNTAPVAYPAGGGASNAFVGCASTDQPSIRLGNGGGIYGRATVGASSVAGVTMGWGARIGPRNWGGNGQMLNIAPNAVVPNLAASFQTFSAPTDGSLGTSISLTLDQTSTLGADGTTRSISLPAISLSGNSRLTVRGNVTLTLQSAGTALSVGGSSRLILAPGATLTLYTPGSIELTGDARVNCDNSQATHRLQIYGTGNSAAYRLYNSAAIYALIYSPNASLLLDGNAQCYGAAVVDQVTLTGSSAFHQDEAVARTGPSDSLRVTAYRELATPTTRAPFAALLRP